MMTTAQKYFTLLTLVGTLGLAGCGSSNSAHVVTNGGQQYQLDVSATDCYAGPPTGVMPGFDGVMDAPLTCQMNFQTGQYFSDFLSILVSDVRPVYDTLGTWQMIGGGLAQAYLTLSGVPQAIFYGQVRFTQISNVSGNKVCAEYQIVTADAQIDGNFCDKVRSGY